MRARRAAREFADQVVMGVSRQTAVIRIGGFRIQDAGVQQPVVVVPQEDLQGGRSGLRRSDVNARDAGGQRGRNPMESELMQ